MQRFRTSSAFMPQLAVVTWLIVTTSCGAEPSRVSLDDAERALAPSGTPATSESSDVLEVARGLVGRYAIKKTRAIIQNVPVLGDTPTLTHSYGLGSIELAGDHVELVERYCRSVTDSPLRIRAIVPDALPRSMGELRQPISVRAEGGVVRWSRDETVVVLGARLNDPWGDPLPLSAADARVFDQDRDGHPGVSIEVRGFVSGWIYVVQRSFDRYDGVLDADGHLQGLLDHASDSKIVAASSRLLRGEAPIRMDPDPSKSTIRLVPWVGESDCDTLLANLSTLFGP